MIWAQFYDHEGHEGKNLLLKINDTPANSTGKTYLDNTLVRSPTDVRQHTKRTKPTKGAVSGS